MRTMHSAVKLPSKCLRTPARLIDLHRVDRRDRVIHRVAQNARDAVGDDLWYGAIAESDHRCAGRHRLDHHEAEGLRPIDREGEREGVAEEILLLFLVDLADELDEGMVDHRLDDLVPVILVSLVDLRGDLQRNAGADRHLDRTVGALLRGDAAEEGEVAALRLRVERAVLSRQSVMDGREPVDVLGHRIALVVRDRHQGHAREGTVDRHEVRHVEAPVHRREALVVQVLEHRVLQQVDMEVQNVELVRPLVHVMQHREVARGMITIAEKTEAFRRAGCQLGRSLRIAAGEQGHVVALADQFLGDPRHHALGTAIELRGYGLRQRSNLSNAHEASPMRSNVAPT